MKRKNLVIMALATLGLITPFTPALAQSGGQDIQVKYTCESKNGIPVTVASVNKSEDFIIWKPEILPPNEDAQKLCEASEKKLNKLSKYGSLNLSVYENKTAEVIEICAATDKNPCLTSLLTAGKNVEEADKILTAIVPPQFQKVDNQVPVRGYMTNSFRVNWWELLW